MIHVYTGDVLHAGTNANVLITVFGENGDSGERKLNKSEKHMDKFERNQVTSLHSTSLYFTPLHSTPLHFTSLHFTSLYFTLLHFTSLHFTSLHFTPLHFTSLHSTPLHSTSLHSTSLYFTSLHFTPLHSTSLHFTSHLPIFLNKIFSLCFPGRCLYHQMYHPWSTFQTQNPPRQQWNEVGVVSKQSRNRRQT